MLMNCVDYRTDALSLTAPMHWKASRKVREELRRRSLCNLLLLS